MHLLFQKCRIFFASKDENLTHISVLNDMHVITGLQQNQPDGYVS